MRIIWNDILPSDIKLTWTNKAGEKLVLSDEHFKIHDDFIMSEQQWMAATWLTESSENLVRDHMGTPYIVHDAQFLVFDGGSTDIDFHDGGHLLVEYFNEANCT